MDSIRFPPAGTAGLITIDRSSSADYNIGCPYVITFSIARFLWKMTMLEHGIPSGGLPISKTCSNPSALIGLFTPGRAPKAPGSATHSRLESISTTVTRPSQPVAGLNRNRIVGGTRLARSIDQMTVGDTADSLNCWGTALPTDLQATAIARTHWSTTSGQVHGLTSNDP